MDYLLENWGNFVGVLGLLASIGGLVYALLARRAAKSAEQAAREARQETRRTVSRSRRSADTGRAIALINRLKVLHRDRHWDYALELYQDLRSTLSDIQASMPDDMAEIRNAVSDAIHRITDLEAEVNRARYENGEPSDVPQLDGVLSDIQESLERLQSTDRYGQ